ncbi:MAG TPA: error-prone DNA polymerase [Stellaceae bacterium]|nr:error-prone DNA polymerase [Stellaceae bacterium]
MADYAELQVTSNFSFLRGGSHPHELVAMAEALGHRAIAITDRNTLAGVVRAHAAAEDLGFRLVIGCRLDLADAPSLLCFPTDRAAYGRLSRLLTRGKRRAEKGQCHLTYADLLDHGAGQLLLALPPEDAIGDGFADFLPRLAGDFRGQAYIAAQHRYGGDDAKRLHRLALLAKSTGLPLVATNDVLYHTPKRRPLQDVLTCIRDGVTIAAAGFRLAANAERHLKSSDEMARLFREHPRAVARTLEIVERTTFNLSELRYVYPDETDADGTPPQEKLTRLAWEGAARRYPAGVPEKIRGLIAHELALIAGLNYAPYFLTVYEIMSFARANDILCQGRGSAANSTVCFCLGITDVDPNEVDLLFERFVSSERNEPPDIDVDFEHERRELVIQHIYEKYGRNRAGMTAVVSCYRARGAIREVGKALELSDDVTSALAGTVWGWSGTAIDDVKVREVGLDPSDLTLRLALELSAELIGFPRHLSQHVGGFVITRGLLEELVPIENAAMADRTVIEWDKDDLNVLGILKIDVLGLGMLSCIRRAFELLDRDYGKRLTLASVPQNAPEVYDMLGHADSIGVFQVESRAQMSMLPRLKPREFFDLVIEVAIVRPGPIQGDMVHPYLRRRMGLEPPQYPRGLEEVLGRTYGVPLFQEQAMKIAMIAAGFTAGEADGLRRAMATFRRNGDIVRFEEKFIAGMIANNYEPDFARRCFEQIKGFSDYGFPLSHAASFALLVYVSAWLKCFHPEVFACALLNSQPMGFYAPAQIVRDAQAHGVEVRPADVNLSDWDCTLEASSNGGAQHVLRLGFREVKGLAQAEIEGKLVSRRGTGFSSVADLQYRAQLSRRALEHLADADAFRSLGLDRRHALWAVKGLRDYAPSRSAQKAGESPLVAVRSRVLRQAQDEDRSLRPLAEASLDLPHPEPVEGRTGGFAAPADKFETSLPLFASLAGEAAREPAVMLPPMGLGEHVLQDYRTTGLSLKEHPLALLRGVLEERRILPNRRLQEIPAGTNARVAGLVLIRQQPGSAKGVIFMTLEDETGIANIIVWRKTFERFRPIVMGARLVQCEGPVQREGEVIHVVAHRLIDLSPLLRRLSDPGASRPEELVVQSRDFR